MFSEDNLHSGSGSLLALGSQSNWRVPVEVCLEQEEQKSPYGS